MALFKILKGNEANLPSIMTDGWAYFCTDTSNFFIDYEDDGGVLHRAQLNAKDAETILGLSPASVINNNELEIPKSSAVFEAIQDAKSYTDTSIANLNLITTDDIDTICNGVTEGALTQTDVDELMAELNPEEAI